MNIVRSLIVQLGFDVNTRPLDQAVDKIDGIAPRVTPGLEKLRNLVAGVFAGFSAVAGIRSIVDAGDQMTKVMNRVRESATVPQESFEDLYNSARETGVAMDETSKSFMRFAPALRRAGFADKDTIGLIDGLQKGLLLAGSSAAETGSILVQLGQAINSNNFAGDELKSFMENASPQLIEKFAEGLHTTVDQIKKLGSEGKLTNSVVLPALISAARAGRDAFGRMEVTVELAMARSRVAWIRFAGELNDSLGLNSRLIAGFEAIGRSLDWLRTQLPALKAFLSTSFDLVRAAEATGAALAVMFSPAIVAGLRTLALFVTRTLLPFAALYLVIEDIIGYMQGSQSVIGDFIAMFSPEQIDLFNRAIERVKENFRALRDYLASIVEYIASINGASIKKFLSEHGWQFRDDGTVGNAAPGPAARSDSWLESYFRGLARSRMGGAEAPVSTMPSLPVPAPSPAPSAAPSGGSWWDTITKPFRSDWLERYGRPNGNGMPTVGSITPQPNIITLNPTINQELNVTAPGSDGASIGSTVGTAAQGAAENAMRFGNDLARDLLRGNPATEAGAR